MISTVSTPRARSEGAIRLPAASYALQVAILACLAFYGHGAVAAVNARRPPSTVGHCQNGAWCLALAQSYHAASSSSNMPGRGYVMQLVGTVKKDARSSASISTSTSSGASFSASVMVQGLSSAVKKQQQPQQLTSAEKVSGSPYVSVEIRKPDVEELVSVVDLRLEVFCGMRQAANPEMRERSLKQLLTRQRKGSQCLVATAQDMLSPSEEPAVVGTVEFSTHEFSETTLSPSCDTNLPKLYVTEMAVSDGFRRRGVASGLLKAVDEHAKAMGIPFICLFVETKNKSAIDLYLKAGYHLVPYSAQAVAFASAIGLYSGPLANREYYFCYKRLPVASPAVNTAASAPTTWGRERGMYATPRLAM